MITLTTSVLTCEQTLRGALAAGREKELSTTSLEFDYLHRKYRYEMLIGGDNISNDVITLGTCFSTFVYICARFRFMLIGRNLTAQSTGSHRGIGDVVASSPSFSCLGAPESLLPGYFLTSLLSPPRICLPFDQCFFFFFFFE